MPSGSRPGRDAAGKRRLLDCRDDNAAQHAAPGGAEGRHGLPRCAPAGSAQGDHQIDRVGESRRQLGLELAGCGAVNQHKLVRAAKLAQRRAPDRVEDRDLRGGLPDRQHGEHHAL